MHAEQRRVGRACKAGRGACPPPISPAFPPITPTAGCRGRPHCNDNPPSAGAPLAAAGGGHGSGGGRDRLVDRPCLRLDPSWVAAYGGGRECSPRPSRDRGSPGGGGGSGRTPTARVDEAFLRLTSAASDGAGAGDRDGGRGRGGGVASPTSGGGGRCVRACSGGLGGAGGGSEGGRAPAAEAPTEPVVAVESGLGGGVTFQVRLRRHVSRDCTLHTLSSIVEDGEDGGG